MSKPSAKKPSHHRRKSRSQSLEQRRASDRTIYIGVLVIGLFIVLIAWLLTMGKGGHWREITIAYVVVMAWLTNFYTYLAYRGKQMANWKQALARLPLRFAGYGTKKGRPLDAAHGRRDARNMLLISITVSIVVIVLLCVLIPPDLTSYLE
jgi:F0F1-type ATP synthase assembly protein I